MVKGHLLLEFTGWNVELIKVCNIGKLHEYLNTTELLLTTKSQKLTFTMQSQRIIMTILFVGPYLINLTGKTEVVLIVKVNIIEKRENIKDKMEEEQDKCVLEKEGR